MGPGVPVPGCLPQVFGCQFGQLHGQLQQPTKTTTSAIPVPYFTGGSLLASPYRVRRLPKGSCSSVWRDARTAIPAELLPYSRSKVHSSTTVSMKTKARTQLNKGVHEDQGSTNLHRDKVSVLRATAEEEVQLLMKRLFFWPKTGTPRRTCSGPPADQCCRQRPKGAIHKTRNVELPTATAHPNRTITVSNWCWVLPFLDCAKPSRTMELARWPTPPMAVEPCTPMVVSVRELRVEDDHEKSPSSKQRTIQLRISFSLLHTMLLRVFIKSSLSSTCIYARFFH